MRQDLVLSLLRDSSVMLVVVPSNVEKYLVDLSSKSLSERQVMWWAPVSSLVNLAVFTG